MAAYRRVHDSHRLQADCQFAAILVDWINTLSSQFPCAFFIVLIHEQMLIFHCSLVIVRSLCAFTINE